MSRKEKKRNETKREMFEGSKTARGGGKKVLFFIVILATIALAGAGYYAKSKRGGPAVETGRKVDLAGMRTDVFSIPLSEITREAKFYEAMVGEVPVRFFVMMSSDGVIRSALDACDTCAHTLKGYRQEGDFMVCNNCDQRFPSTMINVVRGGCNPVPLNNETYDGELRIRVADIQQCIRYFDFKR